MAGKRKVEVRSRRTAYKGRYRIEEVVFDFDRATGKGRIADAKREIFERGDSAAALIHDVERDVIVLTEQFRIATHEKGPGYIRATIANLEDDVDLTPAEREAVYRGNATTLFGLEGGPA